MQYDSILLPIDVAHPETAPAMFEQAKALLSPKGKITAVYVVPDIPNYILAEMHVGFLPSTIRKSERALQCLIADAGADADVQILSGQAPRAILAATEGIKSDLVIVSSHRPGLGDYLLGSTAAQVVRHAQCSVLVMR